ncbi:mitochondrial Rho GTPase [Mitosporidium daphniae]|uniref:Mitochondrial Rho GTPase n=1 Tax=Mitosporidium daphniae TaxID=1485682 RepID=A0A098VSL6_9MICR|nr:mitochondrial Rho GTPase [Mitosporidium daphniae]KGG51784.1 mitochondrial Rho GTPase [Mitosporidium daphniae]|eukprot:XP_013238211.1 mitochondrial Rho GTPase [Mitosporidium daphniae]
MIENEIRRSNVAILVLDCLSPSLEDSVSRVREYWMPLIGRTNGQADAIAHSKSALDERLVSLIADFQPTIESIVESSARTLMNVTELFSFAVRAVLYPRLALMDYKSEMCCFGVPLHSQEIEELKATLRSQDDPRGLIDASGGISLQGCQAPVANKDRLPCPAAGIHHPGPLGDIPEGSSCELTPAGYHFILSLFNRHSRNNDGSITWNDLESLFSLVPNGNPWIGTGFPHGTSINEKGELALHGYLTQWSFVDRQIVEGELCPEIQFGLGPWATFEAVNTVEYGPEVRNFVLEEMPWEDTQRILMDRSYLQNCDAIIGIYDSSDALSFAQLANLFRACSRSGIPIKGRLSSSAYSSSITIDEIPVVIIANKSDLAFQKQVFRSP